jgi:Fe-S cluster assembly protein SufD
MTPVDTTQTSATTEPNLSPPGSALPHLDLRPTTTSFDPEAFEVPTGREEIWRFTPLRRLNGLHKQIDSASAPKYLAPDTVTGVAVNVVDRGSAALDRALPPTDRIAALAWQAMSEAVVLDVSSESDQEEPILLTVVSTGEGTTCGHVLVDVAAQASVTVIIDHVGTGIYAGDISVRLGDGARATVVTLQRMDDDAALVGNVRATVGRDATLRSVAVTLSGGLVRLATSVSYTGPGGDAELVGAFFTSAGQHQEHRLFVDHNEQNCRSNVVYKGALAGDKAHSVWIGDVLIRSEATGTETFELNRNLVLTRGARADSVPNLEIETGDVTSAGHAAATGKFDAEQLFYLQSRGIPAHEARRLVVRGFFADVVRRIGVKEVEKALLASVDQKLATLVPSETA